MLMQKCKSAARTSSVPPVASAASTGVQHREAVQCSECSAALWCSVAVPSSLCSHSAIQPSSQPASQPTRLHQRGVYRTLQSVWMQVLYWALQALQNSTQCSASTASLRFHCSSLCGSFLPSVEAPFQFTPLHCIGGHRGRQAGHTGRRPDQNGTDQTRPDQTGLD